jgi:hypothetical protein
MTWRRVLDEASRPWRAASATALALALLVATTGCDGVGSTPTPPSLPGSPGHFDNGELSFDYPTDWPIIRAGESSANGVFYILAVLGTGTWHENCVKEATTSFVELACGADVVEVPAGGIVVKIYWRGGGPAPSCLGDTQANATLGPNAVRKTTDGATTSWEIRPPDGEFGWPNNPIFEAHTSDPAQLARAEAMVASFRWGPSAPSYPGLCSPSPVVSAGA